MKLTCERKRYIDGLSYLQLAGRWCFAPDGVLWFEGETGDYWWHRMQELRPAFDSQKRHPIISV